MLEKHRRRAVGVPYALAFWAELSVQWVEINSEVAIESSWNCVFARNLSNKENSITVRL
jgi:hypothetical protein